jgi:DNA-binding PadR family transcriptional regulator
MQAMSQKTATRNAILGHLALRDWSAYELTRSVKRTLHWFWPRAESGIYAEVKRLQDEGLADAREEPAVDGSARTRIVYRITPKGRRALKTWLASPPDGLALYIEPLLRLHLARFGTKEELLGAIATLKEEASSLLDDGRAVAGEFVAGRHLLQDEAHVRGMLFDALWSIGKAMEQWAIRARAEAETWPDPEGDAAAKARGVDVMRTALATEGKRRN